MTRPPYLRRLAALAVFLAAVAVEFRPSNSDQIPVASSDLPQGTEITGSDVVWLEVERGVVDPVELPAVLGRSVRAGAPITHSDVDPAAAQVPGDWLRIELEVPPATSNGDLIVAVLPLNVSDRPVSGVVVGSPTPSDFGTVSTMVAFEPGDAVAVARGLAEGQVMALLGS